MKDKKEMKGKIEYFFKRKLTVHIKTSDRFYNGLIIEIVGKDFIILCDRVIGETPIYLNEIKILEKFNEDVKGGQNKNENYLQGIRD